MGVYSKEALLSLWSVLFAFNGSFPLPDDVQKELNSLMLLCENHIGNGFSVDWRLLEP